MKRNYLIAGLVVSVGAIAVPWALYAGISIASPVFLGGVAFVLIKAISKTPLKVVLKTLGQLALGIVCLIPVVMLLTYLLNTVIGGLLVALGIVFYLLTPGTGKESKSIPSDNGAWKG